MIFVNTKEEHFCVAGGGDKRNERRRPVLLICLPRKKPNLKIGYFLPWPKKEGFWQPPLIKYFI